MLFAFKLFSKAIESKVALIYAQHIINHRKHSVTGSSNSYQQYLSDYESADFVCFYCFIFLQPVLRKVKWNVEKNDRIFKLSYFYPLLC